MLNGLACITEFKKASAVCPDKVLPEASVIVPEIMISSFLPIISSYFLIATIAAFAFRVSNIVSISNRSAPPSTKPRTCS